MRSDLCLMLTLAAILLFWPLARPAEAQDDLESTVQRLESCGVPAALTSRLLALGLEGQMAPAEAASLARTLLAPCTENFPVAPFADKTAEGLAKHIPAPRIQSALEAKLEDYRFARTALASATQEPGWEPTPEQVGLAGESLALGVEREELATLVRTQAQADPAMLLTAVQALAYMKQAGYDADMVRPILDAGLNAQSLTPEWVYLSRVALTARKRGVGPEQLRDAAIQALSQGHDLRSLTRDLGFTARNNPGPVQE
ncbi:MAG: hypothetical protein V3573_05755 [Desulfovibrionaceae bacterium]